MVRFLKIFSIIVFCVISIAIIGGIVFMRSTAGLTFVERRAEAALSIGENGQLEIGRLEGTLPHRLIAHEITLSDVDGVWLTAKSVELDWHPFALLDRRIEIDRLSLDTVLITRTPVPKEEPEQKQPRKPLDLSSLPKIDLRSLIVDGLTIRTNEQQANWRGIASLNTINDRLAASFDLHDSAGTDRLNGEIDLNFTQMRYDANAQLIVAENGATASLIGFENGLLATMSAKDGDGHVALETNFDAGALGTGQSTIHLSTQNYKSAQWSGVFEPGAGLEQLSSNVIWDIDLERGSHGFRAVLNQLSIENIESEGTLDLVLDEQTGTQQLSIDLLTDGKKAPKGLQNILNDHPLGTTAEFQFQEKTTAFSAEFSVGRNVLQIFDGVFDSNSQTQFAIKSQLAVHDFASLGSPLDAEISSDVQISADRVITAPNLDATFSDGSSITGDLVFSPGDNSLRSDLDISVVPVFLKELADQIEMNAPIEGKVKIAGTLSAPSIDISAMAGALSIGDWRAPLSRITATFEGPMENPNSNFFITGIDEPDFALSGFYRPDTDGILDYSLAYRDTSFSLTAEGAIDPLDHLVSWQVQYDGDPNAVPFPGIVLAGNAQSEGNFNVDRRQFLESTLQSEALSINAIELSGLSVTTKPTDTATEIDLNLASLKNGSARVIERMTASILAQSSLGQFTINSLTSEILSVPLSLSAPGIIHFGEGTQINLPGIRYGDGTGSIALNYANSVLVSSIDTVRTPIPGTALIISLAANVDTNAEMPGKIDLSVNVDDGSSRPVLISGIGEWNGKTLSIAPGNEGLVSFRGTVPALLTRAPSLTVSTEGDIAGSIDIDGDVGPIFSQFPNQLQTLTGETSGSLTLSGTVASPALAGKISLSDGSYTEIQSGLSLDAINLGLDFSSTTNSRTAKFSGTAKGAGQQTAETITLTGEVNDANGLNVDLLASFKLAEFTLHPVNAILVNGDVKITAEGDEVSANGALDIDHLDAEIVAPPSTGLVDIDVFPYGNSTTEAAPATTSDASPTKLNLDIDISADNRLFVRGRGIESEWKADTVLTTLNGAPVILGSSSIVRGTLDFAGRRFDIRTGEIEFDRIEQNNPILDIEAVYVTEDGLTAVVSIAGRGREPQISLTSTPARPAEDIMALVLFGKPASELSAVESLQTAQALAALGGIGPFGGTGITGGIRDAVGLDLLNIDIDPETGGGSLAVGKYVTDDIFIAAEQDATGDGGSVRVEYSVTDQITVETDLEQNGDQTVSANWKRDF